MIGAVSHYRDSKKEFYLAYVPAKVPKPAKVPSEGKKALITNQV
jgi:hypothetical protein